MFFLPPLRLTGGMALRDGALQKRSVAIARGRITKGPLPALDLEGYLILPGIIDLMRGPVGGPAQNRADAAAAGVTTAWLARNWSWEEGDAGFDSLEARLDDHYSAADKKTGTDLRNLLRIETHCTASEARLLQVLERWPIDKAVFSNRAKTGLELRQADPLGWSQRAAALSVPPELLSQRLDEALLRTPDVPRFLCNLAEVFDRKGIVYGSYGDRAGDTREHYRMIGARLALAPAGSAAASAARAMGDPVLAAAGDVLSRPVHRVAALDLIEASLCDGLFSGGASGDDLARAAFALADSGVMGLAEAWALISKKPAMIMRMADRGLLAYGRRADIVIICANTRKIEATIAGGRLTYLAGRVASRFQHMVRVARNGLVAAE